MLRCPAFDFDAVHAAATAAWTKELQRMDVTAPPAVQKNLYTAMYHALMSPNLSMDVDGSYRGPDNQVHHAAGFHFVSNLSLWDTYRAEQPLMTLLEPEARTSDLVNSMLASQRESPFGILPIWQEQGHRNLVHDWLPCCAGNRRCIPEGHSRIRR